MYVCNAVILQIRMSVPRDSVHTAPTPVVTFPAPSSVSAPLAIFYKTSTHVETLMSASVGQMNAIEPLGQLVRIRLDRTFVSARMDILWMTVDEVVLVSKLRNRYSQECTPDIA